MSPVSKFQKFFCSLFYFMILYAEKIREKDKIYRSRPIVDKGFLGIPHQPFLSKMPRTLRTVLVQIDVTSNWQILAATSYRITLVLLAVTFRLDLMKHLSFCIHFLDIKMQYTLFFRKKCTIKGVVWWHSFSILKSTIVRYFVRSTANLLYYKSFFKKKMIRSRA